MESTLIARAKALVKISRALGECVKECGPIPAGHLYAECVGMMDLATFELAIKLLVDAGKVKRDGSHLLTWIGGAE